MSSSFSLDPLDSIDEQIDSMSYDELVETRDMLSEIDDGGEAIPQEMDDQLDTYSLDELKTERERLLSFGSDAEWQPLDDSGEDDPPDVPIKVLKMR